MSSCSRIYAQALLQSVQEMVQSLSELHDLRRRVREAEASFAKAKRLRHDGLLPDENRIALPRKKSAVSHPTVAKARKTT